MVDNAVMFQRPDRIERIAWHLGWTAGGLALVALALAGVGVDGYSQAKHPVALLGASGTPGAAAFNLAFFVVPGLAATGFAFALERRLGCIGAGRTMRIGTGVLMLAGLGFALQGIFPLALQDLEGAASRRHAAAQALAQLAWIAACALLAPALIRYARASLLAGLGLIFALLMLVDMLRLVPGWGLAEPWPRPVVERALWVMWFLWLALLSVGVRLPARLTRR